MASETILTAARQAYLRGVRRRGRFVTFMRYAILAGVIALWELAAQLGWIDPFITSCPSRVAATIARLAADGEHLRRRLVDSLHFIHHFSSSRKEVPRSGFARPK